MEIKLYDRNLSSPILIDEMTNKVQGLRFSTHLHGGFWVCSFRLKADLPKAWEWITDKAFYRLVITDKSDVLWEGRIEDIGLSQGAVEVTAYGYYANLGDIPYKTAYNDNFDVVVKAVLTANCPQISDDQSNITATGGPAITSAAKESYLDIYPKDIVEKLSQFSDSTYHGRWYFAIWEDRVPYLFRRAASSIDWLVTLADFNQFKLKHQGANLWNSCYAAYKSGGTLARTADADDASSQEKYNLKRQYVIPDLGEVAAATAQSARDYWLEENKELYPSLENMALGGTAYDANGQRKSSALVRAGDVIRIRDLVPASVDAGSVQRDRFRTFYIVETEYDMDNAELRIVPDTEKMSLDAILARKI